MREWLVIIVATALTGCSVSPSPPESSQPKAARSQMGFKIDCYMGHVRSIVLQATGPGMWILTEEDLGVCDANDRT